MIIKVGPGHKIGQQDFNDISVGDVYHAGFDLSGRIRGAEPSIATATWASIPEGLTFSNQAIANLIATATISTTNADSNRTYIITCQYTDSEGETRTVKAKMRVRGNKELT